MEKLISWILNAMVVAVLLFIGFCIAAILALYALQFWAQHWPYEQRAAQEVRYEN